MSIVSEAERIIKNVASAYTAASEMGATMPSEQNADNLESTIRSIPVGVAGEAMSIETIREICGYGGIPSGYTILNYIQSSGTQYIDTGFMPNQDTMATVDVQFTSKPTAHACVFGVYTAENIWWAYYRYSSDQYRAVNGSGTQKYIAYADPTIRTTLTLKKDALVVGESEVAFTTVTDFAVAVPLYLFARNRGTDVDYPASCRIYSCQIYDNGTLIRDLIPCINGSGEYGLYDKANGVFYGNAGSGTFTGA